MEPLDLVLTGGTLVRPGDGTGAADLGVRDGRIVLITEPGAAADLPAHEVLDVGGLHVFPGVVDPHQHVGVGNGVEDYRTDTGACALGGVTSAWYMTMAPGGSYLDTLAEQDAAASTRAHIDYGFHPTLMSPEHVAELPQVRDRFGVHTFKYYMHFRGDEGAYLGVSGTHDGLLYAMVEAIGAAGDLLMVHAENPEVVWTLEERLKRDGRVDLAAWDDARPPFVEAEAVRRVTFFAHRAGCELYLVHITNVESLAQVRAARRELGGLVVAVETCPHYLTHSTDYPRGIVGKVNPPLRRPEHREALWEGIADGTIDTLGSDHVGRGLAAKQGTIWTASAGFPSGPQTLPVLLSEGHHRRGIPLERIADLTSRRPAQLLRCADRKGDLRVGLDADLAIVDLDWERTSDPAWLGTFADYSLYEDMPLRGWPRHTFVRGAAVVRDGALVGAPGHGRSIQTAAAVAA
jgi:dihydropyrimidinase